MREYLLYGLRPGETERWTEELLTATPDRERLDRIKRVAALDGFHGFRIAEYTPGERPDFARTLSRGGTSNA